MAIDCVKVICLKKYCKNNDILSKAAFRLQCCAVCVCVFCTATEYPVNTSTIQLLIHVKSKNYISNNSNLCHFCKIIFR